MGATLPEVKIAVDFNRYDAVLLDLDGTVYHREEVLPGARALIERLHAGGHVVGCISNSTWSPLRVSERLARMGIDIVPPRIQTAAAAACEYVVGKYSSPRVFNLCSQAVAEMLDGRAAMINDLEDPCDVVIAGTATDEFGGEARQRMALSLLRRGAALVGTSADRVYPSPRGIEFGSGALSVMLGYAANVTPTFTGKPQAVFFDTLCAHLAVSPRRCLLIGDNLEADIAGGVAMGMDTILVLSGVTHPDAIAELPDEQKPGHIIESLADLI